MVLLSVIMTIKIIRVAVIVQMHVRLDINTGINVEYTHTHRNIYEYCMDTFTMDVNRMLEKSFCNSIIQLKANLFYFVIH